jgi:hypothetical protein
MRLHSSFVRSLPPLFALCALAIVACAAGSVDDQGTGADLDAAVVDGALLDAGPPTADAGPITFHDAGAPVVIGGPIDSGSSPSSGDAAAKDAAADAPISCGSPAGTYSTSCSDCAVSGTTLTCQCTNGSGSSTSSSLDLCTCPVLTEISNSNGALSCCGVPGGTYTTSCTACSMTDTMLSCTCTTKSGSTSATTLDLCDCTQATQIANTNGQLTCP